MGLPSTPDELLRHIASSMKACGASSLPDLHALTCVSTHFRDTLRALLDAVATTELPLTQLLFARNIPDDRAVKTTLLAVAGRCPPHREASWLQYHLHPLVWPHGVSDQAVPAWLLHEERASPLRDEELSYTEEGDPYFDDEISLLGQLFLHGHLTAAGEVALECAVLMGPSSARWYADDENAYIHRWRTALYTLGEQLLTFETLPQARWSLERIVDTLEDWIRTDRLPSQGFPSATAPQRYGHGLLRAAVAATELDPPRVPLDPVFEHPHRAKCCIRFCHACGAHRLHTLSFSGETSESWEWAVEGWAVLMHVWACRHPLHASQPAVAEGYVADESQAW